MAVDVALVLTALAPGDETDILAVDFVGVSKSRQG